MQVPQEIRSQVMSLYIQGRSEQEIVIMIGLSQDQVNSILSDLSSPENQNALAYQLALKNGKDGRDTKEFLELIEGKKILFHQGVLPKDALAFIIEVAEFSQTTGLSADVFVPVFGIYNKFASTMSIANYQDLQKKRFQTLLALETQRNEENALQQKYELLNKGSVRKNY